MKAPMTETKKNSFRPQAILAAGGLGAALTICLVSPQAWSQGQGNTTLRNPIIPGAPTAAPYEQVQEDRPPPPGDGDTSAPVTPGMEGDPIPPPSDIQLPPSSPLEPPQVDVPPPPSTPGEDPGLLPGTTSGYKPPALETNVNPQGGLSGDAPTHKWGGQTSHDYGLKRTKGSQTTDFGQPLKQVAAVQPFQSEDGPRPLGSNGAPTQPNLAGAQQTTDLYGNRTLFKGNQHAVMTIAPY
jgi:hypothetical protein